MKTIIIADGITVTTYTEQGYCYVMDALESMSDKERREQEDYLFAQLAKMDPNDPEYSDRYKDLYGFRPR